jgi:transposase
MEVVTLNELVPSDYLPSKVGTVIDFPFIYDSVKHTYWLDNNRPGVDPVVFIKMMFIQYLFGIFSMRQTIKEIETNVAGRWFLRCVLTEEIPCVSTFGKNYIRRFQDTHLFEQIFSLILKHAMER